MEFIVLAVIIVFLGLAFDYTNGFHDAANVVSTVIATKVLAPAAAIVMAGVLNIIGATQVGSVAQTIASGIVESVGTSPYSVPAALLGAISWNILTWYFGIPSSSSYALIGGLIGASLTFHGMDSILWKGLFYKVVAPMVLSPLIGYLMAFLFMKIALYFKRKSKVSEKIFRHLQIGSACLVALAHGLNDAQKSMGAITLGLVSTGFLTSTEIPYWVVIACALVLGLGTASGGMRIIKTVGFSITKIRPIQGFAAESSSSCVILFASVFGMPISSTHMIVGSVTGVGQASHGASRVSWKVLGKLVFAWIVTLPSAALISSVLSFVSIYFTNY